MDLTPLFHPARVAIVGATDSPGPGRAVTRNVLAGWGPEHTFLVHRRRDEVMGCRTYRRLADLPEAPDAVVAATATDAVLEVADETIQAGGRALFVLSAGFSDSPDPAGRERQEALRRKAAAAGLLVCGPNSIGVADVQEGRYLWTNDRLAAPSWHGRRNVAIVSQSGGLLISALKRAEMVHLPLRFLVSSGNEATVRMEDYCEFLLERGGIDVLAVIVESFADGNRWRALAASAAERGVRLVALKLGLSEPGRRAVTAHTGRLAGDAAVARAVLESVGAVVVDSVDHLVAACTMLGRYPAYRAGRVAFVMVSGGTAALVSDLAAREGVRLANLSPATRARLRQALPEYATVANPLDTTGGRTIRDRAAIEAVGAAVLDDPEVDSVVFVIPLDPLRKEGSAAEFLKTVAEVRAARPAKPVFVASTFSGSVSAWMDVAAQTGIPFVEDVAACVRIIARQPAGPSQGEAGPTARRPLRTPEGDVAAFFRGSGGAGVVTEDHCYRLLRAWGLECAPYGLVGEDGDLRALAERLGYPLALKFLSPELPHKAEAGLVQLPLRDFRGVARAHRILAERVREAGASGRFLLQRFVPGGFELMLGMKRDAVFGPVLLMGWGGVWTEAIEDWCLTVPPVGRESVPGLLARLKAFRVLSGVRRGRRFDLAGLADYISTFSELCASLPPDVLELEINPLVVPEEGAPCAVDALAVRGGPSAPPGPGDSAGERSRIERGGEPA